ncbi:MAG: hypothetical protein HY746_02720 [Elusimicrobia bacterium]|nr:hypothetical protein [Elusimicrobiota bacterium]
MKLKLFKIIGFFLFIVMLSFPAQASKGAVQEIINAIKTPKTKKAILFIFNATGGKEIDAAIENLRIQLASAGIDVADKQSAQDIADEFEIKPQGLNDDVIQQLQILLGKTAFILAEGKGNKIALKIYDSISGNLLLENTCDADEFTMMEPQSAATTTMPEVQTSTPQATQKLEKKSERNNFMGIGIGIGNFKKNFKDFDLLTSNNPGANNYSNNLNGYSNFFYERRFSERYTMGVHSGIEIIGSDEYIQNEKTLMIQPYNLFITLYIKRKLTKTIGAYCGGGADFISFKIEDPAQFDANKPEHSGFGGDTTAFHSDAGLDFTLKNFILRLGIQYVFSAENENIRGYVSGGGGYNPGNYLVIIRDGKNIALSPVGQPIANNEKPLNLDLGGIKSFITLSYNFAAW